MIQAASAIALAAATSSVFAWYAAPYQQPVMTQEQQQAMVEQQQAFMQQQTKAMQEAFEAQKKAAEEQMAKLQEMQGQYPAAPGFDPFAFPAAPAFPEMPSIPALGEYPAMPEMPAFPEIGQFPAAPAMPEFAAPTLPSSIQDRMKEMDAYRAASQQRMEERRAAMKAMNEHRRAMRANRPFPYPTYGMMPAPQQQAAAPQDKQTSTE